MVCLLSPSNLKLNSHFAQSPFFLIFDINIISLSTIFSNLQRSTKTLFQDSILSYIIFVFTVYNCNKYTYLYESSTCSFGKTSSVITSMPNFIKIGLFSHKLDGINTRVLRSYEPSQVPSLT